MKISEMNNEQAAEALIRLGTPIGNICDDEKVVSLMEKFTKVDKDLPNIRKFGRVIPEIVAFALKTHKQDVFEIVGALTFKTKADVAKMNFLETVNVFRDSYDEVLKDFFTSSMNQTKGNAEK